MPDLTNSSGSALFGQGAEAVFMLDGAGNFRQANQRFAELLGRAAHELTGTAFLDRLSPDEATRLQPMLARVAAGDVLRVHLRVPVAGGSRELWLRLMPVLTAAGGIDGVWGMVHTVSDGVPIDESDLMDLVEREKQLLLFFNSISDITFALDVEEGGRYRFTFANRAFEKTTGVPAAQVIGRYVDEVIPEPSLHLVLEKYREAVATRKHVVWQETSNYPSGPVTGEVCVTPICDAAGHCHQLVGIVHDLTKEKHIEEDLRRSNERFGYALRATTDAIYEWTVATDMLYWGQGFTELFGYSISQNPAPFGEWAVYVHPADQARVVEGLRRKMFDTQDAYWQEEYRFRRADGTWAYVFDRGYLLRDEAGQPVRMIGAMQDITKRQQAAAEQRRLTERLTRQNADLQQFVYIVSHNLRAPLANALGFTQLLGQVDKASEVFDNSLDKLHTSLGQLDQVLTDVNDILTLRDEPGGHQPEPVPLADVCRQAAEGLGESLRAAGGHLDNRLPDDLRLNGRRAYFHSIFHNLISNAVKYRAEDRPLRIIIAATPRPEGYVDIDVEDNGSGFDQSRIGDDIFQLYRRFHPGKSGRGIGLYLVKAHTEALGGRVVVRSQPGIGTRFTLSFKLPTDENLLD